VGGTAAAMLAVVLVAPMIPAPREAPNDYWSNTGYEDEVTERYEDEIALFYQDVPPELASEALRRGRTQSEARMGEPSPLEAWPDVPTRVLLCRDDRLFPPGFLRRVARERLGIAPDELDGGTLTRAEPPEGAGGPARGLRCRGGRELGGLPVDRGPGSVSEERIGSGGRRSSRRAAGTRPPRRPGLARLAKAVARAAPAPSRSSSVAQTSSRDRPMGAS
jgi:hypothetical protein